MPLRKRLTLIVGGQVVACVLVALVSVFLISRAQVERRGRDEAESLVDRAHVTLESELQRLDILSASVAQDPLVRQSLLAELPDAEHWAGVDFADRMPPGHFVEVRDARGNAVYSSLDAGGAWYLPSQAGIHVTRPAAGSGLPQSEGSGVPVLLGVSAIKDADNRPLGCVIVGRGMDKEFLQSLADETGYAAALWGPDGTPIAGSAAVELPALADILNPSDLTSLQTGKRVYKQSPTLGPEESALLWAAGAAASRTPAAYFAMIVPAVDMASVDWASLGVIGGVSALCVLLSFFTVMHLGSRLTRDIETLVEGTKSIGRGDLNTRVAVSSLQEMAGLGGAFNHMAETLEGSTSKLRESESKLLKANIATRRAYEEALGSLAAALDTRDNETREHSYRVMEFALELGREMGLSDEELIFIERGALLHDIGKIGIPDAILLKPSALSEDEWEVMRAHPRIGFSMLASVDFLAGAAEIIYSHHERWDGGGYPRGLKASEIPIGARIFAVVDTFDAITSDRPYRKAMSYQEARDIIVADAGKQFDSAVVAAFCSIPEERWTYLRKEVTKYVATIRERVARRILDFDKRSSRQFQQSPPIHPARIGRAS